MRGASPVQSGAKTLPLSFTISPFAIFVGASVTITGIWVPQNAIGWAMATIGCGLLSLLKYDSGRNAWAGLCVSLSLPFVSCALSAMPSSSLIPLSRADLSFRARSSVVVGMGLGMLYSATNFAVLAPVKASRQPYAVRLCLSLGARSMRTSLSLTVLAACRSPSTDSCARSASSSASSSARLSSRTSSPRSCPRRTSSSTARSSAMQSLASSRRSRPCAFALLSHLSSPSHSTSLTLLNVLQRRASPYRGPNRVQRQPGRPVAGPHRHLGPRVPHLARSQAHPVDDGDGLGDLGTRGEEEDAGCAGR